MSRLKIGQIGLGHEHASGQMQAMRNLPDVFEVVGVVEEPGARWSKPTDRAYQGIPFMTESELFALPGLQAVSVETNMPLLAETALRCADHGCTFTSTSRRRDDAPFRQLVEGCRAKGLALQMGYMYRGNPRCGSLAGVARRCSVRCSKSMW